MKYDHEELFSCKCGLSEHQIVIKYDNDPDCPEVYVDYYLNSYHRFWGRVLVALKYIFGVTAKYGAFDCTILEPSDADRLQKVVDKLRSCK